MLKLLLTGGNVQRVNRLAIEISFAAIAPAAAFYIPHENAQTANAPGPHMVHPLPQGDRTAWRLVRGRVPMLPTESETTGATWRSVGTAAELAHKLAPERLSVLRALQAYDRGAGFRVDQDERTGVEA